MNTTRVGANALRKNPTVAEKKLWSLIRKRQLNGYKFRRQTPLCNFIVDFVCFDAKLIVELDGPSFSPSAAPSSRF